MSVLEFINATYKRYTSVMNFLDDVDVYLVAFMNNVCIVWYL